MSELMAYSHSTRTGPRQVQGTGPAQEETIDPRSFPCLEPVRTFLYNILGPISLGTVPCICPGPFSVQCE